MDTFFVAPQIELVLCNAIFNYRSYCVQLLKQLLGRTPHRYMPIAGEGVVNRLLLRYESNYSCRGCGVVFEDHPSFLRHVTVLIRGINTFPSLWDRLIFVSDGYFVDNVLVGGYKLRAYPHDVRLRHIYNVADLANGRGPLS